jgi:lysine-N-methylase
MQVDVATRDKYAKDAPELLEAVDTGESEFIMRRDPQTDYCVRFEGGLCGVHRDYGTSFLGDACHFYPRISRQLGNHASMTASLSCPEVTRLALFSEPTVSWQASKTDRLPYSLKDYLPEGLSSEQAWKIHTTCVDFAGNAELSPEQLIACFVSVAASLERQPLASWPDAIAFYLRMAPGRLPTPESQAADPFNLLHMMYGLLGAAKPTARPRLMETLQTIADALHVSYQPEAAAIVLEDDSTTRWMMIEQLWSMNGAPTYAPILRRWVQTQLTMMLFPFAGFGASLSQRAVLLGVRFAITRLALMCAYFTHDASLSAEMIVRIVQSLSRFLDHLADPTLCLRICEETGWVRESRLRALVGDTGQSIPLSASFLTLGVAN